MTTANEALTQVMQDQEAQRWRQHRMEALFLLAPGIRDHLEAISSFLLQDDRVANVQLVEQVTTLIEGR